MRSCIVHDSLLLGVIIRVEANLQLLLLNIVQIWQRSENVYLIDSGLDVRSFDNFLELFGVVV